MGFILVGDTLYIRRLLQETRNHVRESTLPEETTRQTTKSFNHVVNTTFPATEMVTSVFVQFPSRKQLLSRVAKAIHASKGRRGGIQGLRNNSDIWSSFWRNEKSGKLKSEPRELALYDYMEVGWKGEKVEMQKSKQQTNLISKQPEAGDEIRWRLSHLKP